MQSKYRSWLVAPLFIVLALSYSWCILDNILDSAAAMESAGPGPIPTSLILVGLLWLIGHGVHGAAVVIIPVMFWGDGKRTRRDHWPEDFEDEISAI